MADQPVEKTTETRNNVQENEESEIDIATASKFVDKRFRELSDFEEGGGGGDPSEGGG